MSNLTESTWFDVSTVAVAPFKIVVSLELTRRTNDQKIIALKLKILEMMAVLFE